MALTGQGCGLLRALCAPQSAFSALRFVLFGLLVVCPCISADSALAERRVALHQSGHQAASCDADLLEYAQRNLRQQASCSNDSLNRYLSRAYPGCIENVTLADKRSIGTIKLLAAGDVGDVVSSLLLDTVHDMNMEVLVMGVQSSHMIMEVLSELSMNFSDTAAGWILPHWAIDRIRLVLGTVPILPALHATDGEPDGPAAGSRRRQALEILEPGWIEESEQSDALVQGIPLYFTQLSTLRGPSILHMPLDGTVLLMYYRPDILKARNIPMPATWDQVLHVARMLNGTDLNEDGEPDYGFCIEPALDCSFSILAGAILPSMTQTNGTAHGAFLDPDTLMPLFNTTAFTRTMSLVAQFAQLSPAFKHVAQTMLDYDLLRQWYSLVSSSDSATWLDVRRRMREAGTMWNLADCPSFKHTLYQQGRCAFTLGTSHVWKTTQVLPPAHSTYAEDEILRTKNITQWYTRGRMGVAAVPGSQLVYDRLTDTLLPCTETLCPYGIDGTPELVMAADQDGNWGVQYVNRAPYAPVSGVVGAVSAAATREQQHAAAKALVALGGPLHNQLALSPEAPYIVPMRNELLTLDALPNYTAAGFHPDDTKAYLEATIQLLSHPNVVPSPGIPGFPVMRHIMSVCVLKAAAGEKPEQIGVWAQEQVQAHVLLYNPKDEEEGDLFLAEEETESASTDVANTFQMKAFHRPLSSQIVNSTAQYRMLLVNTYRLAIGYWGQTLEQVSSLDPARSLPVVSLVVPIVCTVVTLIVTALYELRKHLQHKDLFGKVMAPGPYVETTLLVTDIESSTVLWEMLPPSVMDQTLHQHHACIRALLLKHCGYESSTEGDSFILAFHCPEDALLFAMECQAALLDCSWPPELLQCEQCAPCYVVPIEKKRKHLAALDGMVDDLPHMYDRDDELMDTMNQLIQTGLDLHSPSKAGAFDTTVMLDLAPASVEVALSPSQSIRAEADTPSTPSHHHVKPFVLSSWSDVQPPAERTSFANTHTVTVRPEAGGVAGPSADKGEFCTQSSLTGASGAAAGTHGGQSTSSIPNQERTFLSEVKSGWKIATSTTPGAVVIFRGLRVRMGMTSGVDSDADVLYNKAAARTHYSGRILTLAKAVGDAAGGGCVLLTQSCYALLPMASLWDKALIMHVGEYELHDGDFRLHLYQVMGRRLLGRLAHLETCVARCSKIISRGVLSAPLGSVAIAHTQAVGAMTLLAWNQSAARRALAIFFEEAEIALLSLAGTYVADMQVDQVAIVFVNAADAIVWGLLLHKALLEADWPPELCEHELCEEVCVNGVVMFRGLRVKVGIDCGEVMGEIHALTGRCQYKGRPMARSARVMQTATSNQVLCTSQAWATANQPTSVNSILQHRVSAEPLGLFKLKGMLDRTELLQCRLASEPLVNKRRASTLAPGFLTDMYPLHLNE